MSSIINRLYKHSIPEPNSGCRLWLGAANPRGYGKLGVGGSTVDTHRLSYEAHIGPIPSGLSVLHRCDTPGCIEPSHLFLGTQAENLIDMCVKGRSRAGERHHGAKIDAAGAAQVRGLCANGMKQSVVAGLYGISQQQVSGICCGRFWA